MIFIKAESKAKQALLRTGIYTLLLFFLFLGLILFVKNDYGLYSSPIGKVISITEARGETLTDISGNNENSTKQHITLKLMNGIHKGEKIQLTNDYTYTGAFDSKVIMGQDLFIGYSTNDAGVQEASITEFKRDVYLVYILLIFSSLMILVGRKKGLATLLSIFLNILLLYFAINLYIGGINIVLISVITAVIYIALSMLIICGPNRKSLVSGICTLVSTGLAILLALLCFKLTGGSGLHFEVMEFNIGNYEQVYLSQIIIGTLGGAMDIAVTIASAVFEMYRVNPEVDLPTIRKSAKVIGIDIMGTMANTLVLAYMSGAFPTGILLLCNNVQFADFITFYLNLEIIRALVGSIAIVLSIPITIELSARLIHRFQQRKVVKL